MEFLAYLLCILLVTRDASAFSLKDALSVINRRSFCWGTAAVIALAPACDAAVVDSSISKFDFNRPLTEERAISRFQEGRKSLAYLIENYDDIANGGGDNVRRYLGTVGTTSGLWGISKIMTYLGKEVDVDIVEFSESQNEVEAALRSADSAAYMAIFVTSSSSNVPPTKYFEDARLEAKVAKKYMDQVAKELGL